jgi:hypothetical protein
MSSCAGVAVKPVAPCLARLIHALSSFVRSIGSYCGAMPEGEYTASDDGEQQLALNAVLRWVSAVPHRGGAIWELWVSAVWRHAEQLSVLSPSPPAPIPAADS